MNGATVTTDSVAAGPEAPQQFPPTLREVMIRPTWIGMLVLCLIVAGVFAWLGQWQLSNAIDTDVPPPGATEQVKPIESIVEPGEYLQEPVVGQKVEADGSPGLSPVTPVPRIAGVPTLAPSQAARERLTS